MAADSLDQRLAELRGKLADDVGLPRITGYYLPKWAAGVMMALAFGVVLAMVALVANAFAANSELNDTREEAACRAQVAADHIVAFGQYVISDGQTDDSFDALFLQSIQAQRSGVPLTDEQIDALLLRYQDARVQRVGDLQDFQASQVARLDVVAACD